SLIIIKSITNRVGQIQMHLKLWHMLVCLEQYITDHWSQSLTCAQNRNCVLICCLPNVDISFPVLHPRTASGSSPSTVSITIDKVQTFVITSSITFKIQIKKRIFLNSLKRSMNKTYYYLKHCTIYKSNPNHIQSLGKVKSSIFNSQYHWVSVLYSYHGTMPLSIFYEATRR
ncbi:hypothetical protein AGLY_016208, partial [Aphis glycines]